MDSASSKIVLPEVDTCRWRHRAAGSPFAECRFVGALVGLESGELLAVSDETCTACCRSFPPTRRLLNPVVASVVHHVASRLLEAGDATAHDAMAAARARSLADRSVNVCLPDALRVTPARGLRPCAWRGRQLPTDEPIYACEHPEHDVASDMRCRVCPDWAHRRPISRRMSLAELVPFPETRCGHPIRRWAVAITTAPRRDATLEASLDSVVRAGWESPRLFLDGTLRVPARYAHLPTSWREEGVGAWPAWYLALTELVLQNPEADAYLMLQDDVILHDRESLRIYLERVLWPGDREGVLSLFYTGDDTRPGWHRESFNWYWGAQVFVIPPSLARQLLVDPFLAQSVLIASPDRHMPIPTALAEWQYRNEIDFWYPAPSLAQHIGNTSAIWQTTAWLALGRRAPWFSESLEDAVAIEDDLAGFPEAAFVCNASDLPAYREQVARGRERMRASSVVFCGLCRDVRHFLPRLAARIECLGSMFRDYRVVLFENDSRDATVEFLNDWKAINPRVEVLSTNEGVRRYPQTRSAARAEWLARCRNRYRDHAVAQYADFDHAIVIDTDLAGGWSYEGLAHTFGANNWDAVGSYGLERDAASRPGAVRYRHYDLWAFRQAAGTPARSLVDDARPELTRGSPLLPVESCFGGLCVYRMACLRACAYAGGDCEHVVLHDQLRRAGLGRIFLNPSQIALYTPA